MGWARPTSNESSSNYIEQPNVIHIEFSPQRSLFSLVSCLHVRVVFRSMFAVSSSEECIFTDNSTVPYSNIKSPYAVLANALHNPSPPKCTPLSSALCTAWSDLQSPRSFSIASIPDRIAARSWRLRESMWLSPKTFENADAESHQLSCYIVLAEFSSVHRIPKVS